MKLLLIGPVPPSVGGKTSGGIATHMWELAACAAKNGYQVTILSDTSNKSTDIDTIRIIAFPSTSSFMKGIYGMLYLLVYLLNGKLRTVPDFINLIEKIKLCYYINYIEELLDAIKPDVIHLHNEHSRAALALSFVKNNISYAFTDHAFWQTTVTEFHEKKVRWIIKQAKCLIYTSDFCLEKHNEHHIEFQCRKKILYPLDVSKFPSVYYAVGEKNKKNEILFVGVWEALERKGLDILFKAFFESNRPNWKLKVVTTEETIHACRQLFGSEYDMSSVDFYSPQLPKKLSQLFRQVDVFVMPSRSESFGIVYLESLLHGTPVIGFAPVIREITSITGSYIGEAFNANTETYEQLADKIDSVLLQKVDKTQLQNFITNKFSWEVLWAEFDTTYKAIRKK